MNFSTFSIKSSVFIYFIFILIASAEPFLAPHDPFLRHEIRLLQDEGMLNSTINSWPINLGGLMSEKNKQEWGHDLLGDKMQRDQS